jgi:hypothetical protein
MQLFAPGIVQAARQEKREKPPDSHPGRWCGLKAFQAVLSDLLIPA